MPGTIDEYIAECPPDVQAALRDVRVAVRGALPDAQEKIAYGMPALVLAPRWGVYFGAWKHHIGLYPVPRTDDPLESELAPYRAHKDTLRFPLDQPMPVDLIRRAALLIAARYRSSSGDETGTA